EAAPYPPPSDPLLATSGFDRILLPRSGPTGLALILLPSVRAITLDLASALSSGSNFGWSLFFLPRHLCMAALPIARLWFRSSPFHIGANGGSRGFAASSKVKGPGPGPWPRPSPRARPLCFRGIPP